jgi:DNA-binding transcriptional LysR family regulator
MHWQAVTFDWNQLRAFLATVEEGSLSAAARALGLTQPTVGRQIAALEEELGVILLERSSRAVTPTQSGLELLDHARAMGEAATRVSLAASGQSQDISGLVRITASDMMSAYVLPGMLAGLRDEAPGLQIDLVATNDIRDLLRREADIAVRHVRPEQADLIARLVREETGHPWASSSYLERRGRPKTLADLAKHDFVGFGDNARMIEHLVPLGYPVTLENFRIGSQSGVVAWQLARQGFGIAMMSDSVAEDWQDMERVLPDLEPVNFPVWLVTHRELHTSRRIRLVFDLLAEKLAGRWTA